MTKKLHGPISDLEMLATIDEGGLGAVEELADTYLRKVVVAKLQDLKRRELVSWPSPSHMWFPTLTPVGVKLKEALRAAELARYEVAQALEYDREYYEAEQRHAGEP